MRTSSRRPPPVGYTRDAGGGALRRHARIMRSRPAPGHHPAWSTGHSEHEGASPCAASGRCHHGGVRTLRLGGAVACLFAAPAPKVVALGLSGVVDPFEASYIQGGIREASAENASAVVLTIDTPGGLDSSMRTITKAIL